MTRYSLFVIFILFLFSACKKEETPGPTINRISFEESISYELNPNGNTPLAAIASFRVDVPVSLKISIAGDEPLEHQFTGSEKQYAIPILGLYPDTTNQIIFELKSPDYIPLYDTIYITTDPLPDFLPRIQFNHIQTNQMEPGWTLCDFLSGKNSHLETHPFVFDNKGVIRWFMDLSFPGNLVMPITLLRNGNILCAFRFTVYEFDMLGGIVHQWDIGQYKQHHDIYEKANGNIIIAVTNTDFTSTGLDHVIELERNSGNITNVWDFRQVLDVDRYVISTSSYDWLHMNSIWPDQTDGGLVISGKHQGVVKVNADNELQWIFAPHKDWGPAGTDGDGLNTNDYLLQAIDQNDQAYPDDVQLGNEAAVDFDWGWGQHAAMLLSNGNLLIFDNGNTRQYGNTSEDYSRIVEYEIDTENQTVKQVWEFGADYGNDLRSLIVSDVDELPISGNRLMSPGIIWEGDVSSSRIIEVTYPDSEVVFDASIMFSNTDNTNEFIWHRFDLNYRAERMQLYR